MANLRESSKSSVDPADVVREPWRCEGCDALMYNLNRRGHPAPGAPIPKFFDGSYKNVCWMCFLMLSVIRENGHLRVMHQRWVGDQERSKKTGNDYFRTS